MNISINTAIVGDIDTVKQMPSQRLTDPRHVIERNIFTDTEPGGVIFTDEPTTDRIKALYYKTQPFELGYDQKPDVFIWLDGKVQVIADDFVQQILDALGPNEIAILKHHERSCVYQEVDHILHCIRKGNQYLATRYADKPLREQVLQYKIAGYPKNNGLNDCCIIAVRNLEITKKIFADWWHVVKTGHFDQIAIQFYCYKYGVKIHPIIFKPGSFIDVPHKLLK